MFPYVTKPLQYESLAVVIEHLEPNLRFHLSRQAPSIRSLEKRVPLKIDTLKVEPLTCFVNEGFYQLGVYRQYYDGREKMSYESAEDEDLDQFGIRSNLGKSAVLPGDIDLRTEVENEDVDREAQLMRRLQISKKHLEQRLQENRSTTGIQNRIAQLRTLLEPYANRRNNIPEPCTRHLQLIIKSYKYQKVRRYPYKTPLYESMKYLLDEFFGGRQEVIQIRSFSIDWNNKILRFPSGIQMKIKNLDCDQNINFDALESLFHASSFSLDTVRVTCSVADPMPDHSIVKETKTLRINNTGWEEELWSPVLIRLSNKRVVLENESCSEPAPDYVDLVEHWLENGRCVGTCYSMRMAEEDTALRCLRALMTKPEVVKKSDTSVTLVMNNSSKLHVSYQKIREPNAKDSKEEIKNNPAWELILEVGI